MRLCGANSTSATCLGEIQTVLDRLAWLIGHDAELENAQWACFCRATLLRAPRALLDRTVPRLGRVVHYGPVECVVEHLKSNDLTPERCSDRARRCPFRWPAAT